MRRVAAADGPARASRVKDTGPLVEFSMGTMPMIDPDWMVVIIEEMVV